MQRGTVRIIGGKWRGRKLPIPEVKDLRPTPDRVRETLFNWLTPYIPGARCLDLFAGSGVLGFEALSRGASYVELVDQSTAVIAGLEQIQQTLKTDACRIYRANVPKQLHVPEKPFDIVFLDPPYAAKLLLPCCQYLESQLFLSTIAYLYLEADCVIEDNDLPSTWHIIKHGRAGNVFYHLAKRELT